MMLDDARQYGIALGYRDYEAMWRSAVDVRQSIGRQSHDARPIRERLGIAAYGDVWMPPDPQGWVIPPVKQARWFDVASEYAQAALVESSTDSLLIHRIGPSVNIFDGGPPDEWPDHVREDFVNHGPGWIHAPRWEGTLTIHLNKDREVEYVEEDNIALEQLNEDPEVEMDFSESSENARRMRCWFLQTCYVAVLALTLEEYGIATYTSNNRSAKSSRRYCKEHGIAPTDRQVMHLHQPPNQKEKDRLMPLHFTRGHWKHARTDPTYKSREVRSFWSGNPDVGIVWNQGEPSE